jgi:hypothetical protein
MREKEVGKTQNFIIFGSIKIDTDERVSESERERE